MNTTLKSAYGSFQTVDGVKFVFVASKFKDGHDKWDGGVVGGAFFMHRSDDMAKPNHGHQIERPYFQYTGAGATRSFRSFLEAALFTMKRRAAEVEAARALVAAYDAGKAVRS